MDDSSLHIIQKKEYEILKKIDSIFKQENITYFLACGTLLGAIRHKGFIPWDDDVDIYICGKDYDRARKALMNSDEGIQWHDFETANEYPYTFPKIVATDTKLIECSMKNCKYQSGVYIDVFPLVSVSDNRISRLVAETKRRIWYSTIRLFYADFEPLYKKILKKIVMIITDPFTIQTKLKQMYTREVKGEKFVLDSGVFGQHALLRKSAFKTNTYKLFVDQEFSVPEGFVQYLSDYYGDYMKLPEEEKRVSDHEIFILEIDNRKII